jgi:hypothetical protein
MAESEAAPAPGRRTIRVPSWAARWLGPEAPLWWALLVAVPILAVGLGLTVGLRLGYAPYVDNDFWWHLATGEWILDHRAIPTTDPFSWTQRGQPWVAHEWLAATLFALIVRGAGYAGLLAVTAAIAVAGFWRLLGGVRAYGVSRRAIVLMVLLWGGPFIRENVLTPRPQLWAFALFAVLLAALAEYETERRQHLWMLPPLFAVWINVNLSALIGIACLGAFTLDRLLRRRLERHLFMVAALSAAALLLNPQGPWLVSAVLEYANPDAMRYERIFEWQAPKVSDPTHLGFWLALPLVPVGVWQLLRGRLWPALAVLAMAWQSFSALRFIPMYMMLAFIFAGWLVWRRVIPIGLPAWTPLLPRGFWPAALAANAAAVAVLVAVYWEPSQFREDPLLHGFPRRAAGIIRNDYPDARLFNVYDYGGYLLHRFDEEQFVFVDGREEMYGEPFMLRYWQLIDGEPGWQESFAEQGITVALIRPWDGLYDELVDDPGWQEVYGDEDSALFVRSP